MNGLTIERNYVQKCSLHAGTTTCIYGNAADAVTAVYNCELAADLQNVWGVQAVGTISRKRRHARSVTAEGDDHTLQGGEAAASVLKGQPPQRMHLLSCQHIPCLFRPGPCRA